MSTSTLCTLWKVTSKSGAAIRITNFEADLIYAGEVYTAVPLENTEIQLAAGLSPDDAEITIPLVEPFSATKLLGGFWRGARVEIKVINWANLAAAPESQHTGYLGEVAMNNLVLMPQYRSLSQLMNTPVGDTYTETCRHTLGDAGCKKNLAAFTFTGTVTSVIDKQRFSTSVVQADNYFHKGKITFNSGANSGLSEETWANTGAALTLFKPMVEVVSIGDAIVLVAGDDKTLATCRDKFANSVNFGGFPWTPGRTRTFTYP